MRSQENQTTITKGQSAFFPYLLTALAKESETAKPLSGRRCQAGRRMPRGGGGAVRKQLVTRLCQAIAADLIAVAGHSRQLHQTPLEGRCSRMLRKRTVVSAETTP